MAALKEHVRRLERDLKLLKERSTLQKASISQGIKESALFGILEKVKRCETENGNLGREVQLQRDTLEKKDKQLQVTCCLFVLFCVQSVLQLPPPSNMIVREDGLEVP